MEEDQFYLRSGVPSVQVSSAGESAETLALFLMKARWMVKLYQCQAGYKGGNYSALFSGERKAWRTSK